MTLKATAGSSTIPLTAMERMIITVKTIKGDDFVCNLFTINTVLDIKSKLQERNGIEKKNIKLMLGAKELTNDITMQDLKDRTGANEIGLVAKERVILNIETPKGETITHDMETTDNIDLTKQKHSSKVNISTAHIKLKFNGAELGDDQSLEAVKVKAANNEIPLVARERLTLNVTKPSGEVVTHEMETTDAVLLAKQRHAEKANLDPKNVKLLYQDAELTDDSKLEELKIKEKSNTVPVVARERMTMNVTMFEGNVMPFEMETTDSVLDLKKKVQDKENLDTHLIKLTYQGKEIHDEDTLEVIKQLAKANVVPIVAKQREEITIKMMKGNTVALEMEPENVILDVKKSLQDSQKIDQQLLKLLFKDQEVTDE